MRILKNQDIIERQSQNIIKAEMSNISMVLQTQQVLVDYFSIDAESSERMDGLKDVYDYIGPDSTIQYNKIENLPIAGVDSLIYQNEYDESVGLDADFSADATIFSNTVQPKPGDCFIIKNSNVPAIFQVTSHKEVLIRDLPTVAIEFQLLSSDTNKITELYDQIKENYVFTISNIGSDNNAVITKEKYFQLKDHVRSYLDLIEMYNYNFYDSSRGLFMFRDAIGNTGNRCDIIDAVLLKLMFDESIIVYDDVVTYANNNYPYTVERIFIDDPKTVDNFKYKKSILYKIITKNKTDLQNRFQFYYDENPQIAKFSGINFYVVESYTNILENSYAFAEELNVFNDLFMESLVSGSVVGLSSIKSAIVNFVNDVEIDFDNLEIADSRSAENFYLLPLLLYAYKQYIKNLRR